MSVIQKQTKMSASDLKLIFRANIRINQNAHLLRIKVFDLSLAEALKDAFLPYIVFTEVTEREFLS